MSVLPASADSREFWRAEVRKHEWDLTAGAGWVCRSCGARERHLLKPPRPDTKD